MCFIIITLNLLFTSDVELFSMLLFNPVIACCFRCGYVYNIYHYLIILYYICYDIMNLCSSLTSVLSYNCGVVTSCVTVGILLSYIFDNFKLLGYWALCCK